MPQRTDTWGPLANSTHSGIKAELPRVFLFREFSLKEVKGINIKSRIGSLLVTFNSILKILESFINWCTSLKHRGHKGRRAHKQVQCPKGVVHLQEFLGSMKKNAIQNETIQIEIVFKKQGQKEQKIDVFLHLG